MALFPYAINWVPSGSERNYASLNELQDRMRAYYSKRMVYYDSDIVGSENSWVDETNLCYKHIISEARKAKKILELGCGKSSILRWFPEFEEKYAGIEFSETLIRGNSILYPKAEFCSTDGIRYPAANESFDLIFSVFVIEHTVFPKLFLDECIRMLKPGGNLIVLAPNYLDYLWMPSQQVARSLNSGMISLKKGNFRDALTSLLYNKWIIPRKLTKIDPTSQQFWINLNPVCFQIENFRPDVDAVYISSQLEIESYLADKDFSIERHPMNMRQFYMERRYLFVHGRKG